MHGERPQYIISLSLRIKDARNMSRNNLLWVYRLGTASCVCIALLKLIKLSSLTSSGVLMLNIIWAILCVQLLCLTHFIQRKCKQFHLQIVFNILCTEHTERLNFFTFLILFFLYITLYEITSNMENWYILIELLLFQQPHITLDNWQYFLLFPKLCFN